MNTTLGIRRRTTLWILAAAMVAALAACDRNASSQDAGTSGSADTSAHAPADVVPGSYADWCGEHEVPESLCTRCNPTLVAAFQATGDWCAEHGLPESQCRICNPNLVIQRPPKPEGTP
jgi:hypothetical protein